MDVLSVDVEVVGDEEAEAGGVEIGAGADDAVGGEAGELPGDVGEDVDGVGDDHEDGIAGVAREGRDDLAEECDVAVDEVQAGLAGDLAGAGGDDAEVGAGRHGVVDGGVDLGAGEEGGGVLQVQHLAAELVGLGVHKDQLVRQVLRQDRLRYGHPHVAGADHGDLRVSLRGGRRGCALDGPEKRPRQVKPARPQRRC